MPLNEGETIAIGNKEMRVYHTPGHTPGCCSFGFQVTYEDREYDGFIFGGPGLNVFREENLKMGIYGGTIQDFQKTIDRLQTFEVDVWLGAHPDQNRVFEKLELLKKGVRPNLYIDPEGFETFITRIRNQLQEFL